MFKLFLDDVRPIPTTMGDYVLATSYTQAILFCLRSGCPNAISFDHDLGTDESGYDFAKWLVNKDLDSGGKWIPMGFSYKVHSANPVGRQNIAGLLDNYLRRKFNESR